MKPKRLPSTQVKDQLLSVHTQREENKHQDTQFSVDSAGKTTCDKQPFTWVTTGATPKRGEGTAACALLRAKSIPEGIQHQSHIQPLHPTKKSDRKKDYGMPQPTAYAKHVFRTITLKYVQITMPELLPGDFVGMDMDRHGCCTCRSTSTCLCHC